MRFPYQATVGSNLRELFQHERLATTSRDLGNSSITRGEGSLDLYQTDSGPVVASFGDLPDGSQGVGVLVGGVMRNAGGLFGEQGSAISGLGTRMGSAEGRLDSHASRLGATENGISALGGRMSTAEGRITTLQGTVGGHTSSISSLSSRVNTTEDRLDAHAQRLGALENDLNALAARVRQLEQGGGIPP